MRRHAADSSADRRESAVRRRRSRPAPSAPARATPGRPPSVRDMRRPALRTPRASSSCRGRGSSGRSCCEAQRVTVRVRPSVSRRRAPSWSVRWMCGAGGGEAGEDGRGRGGVGVAGAHGDEGDRGADGGEEVGGAGGAGAVVGDLEDGGGERRARGQERALAGALEVGGEQDRREAEVDPQHARRRRCGPCGDDGSGVSTAPPSASGPLATAPSHGSRTVNRRRIAAMPPA